MEPEEDRPCSIFIPFTGCQSDSEVKTSLGSEADLAEENNSMHSTSKENQIAGSTADQPKQFQKFCSLSLSMDVFYRWRMIGATEGLKTDTQIASFFVDKYESSSGVLQPSKPCSYCGALLSLICAACQRPPSVTEHGAKNTLISPIVHAATGTLNSTSGCMRKGVKRDRSMQHGTGDHDANSSVFKPDEVLKQRVGETSQITEDSLESLFSVSLQSFADSNDKKEADVKTDVKAGTVEDGNAGEPFDNDEDFAAVITGEDDHGEALADPEYKPSSRQSTNRSAKNANRVTCKTCKKSLKDVRNLRCHIMKHHPEQLYRCPVCNKPFISKENCDIYHMKLHPEAGSVINYRTAGVCQQCGKYCKKLRAHLEIAHGTGRPHKCHICDAAFKTKAGLTSHEESHLEEKTFECPDCGKLFKTRACLNGHRAQHRDRKKHECNVCGTILGGRQGLVMHMRTHTGERPHVCETCGKCYRSTSCLMNHRRAKHGEGVNKPWVCQQCGKSFALNGFLKAHMLRHSNAKPFLCQLCGASYKLKSRLTNHLRTHSDVRGRKCSLCDKAYKTSEGLSQHMRQVHRRSVKRYKCSQCSYTSVNSTDVAVHTRSKHTGERPFACLLCAKAFHSKKELSAHVKLHEPTKSHVCKDCGAAFHRLHRLSSHMRVHTGEKPYQCKQCGETFCWHSGLKWHMRKHAAS